MIHIIYFFLQNMQTFFLFFLYLVLNLKYFNLNDGNRNVNHLMDD